MGNGKENQGIEVRSEMKLVPLDKGLFVKIDDDDFEKISQLKWYAHKARDTFYATSTVGALKMHRFVVGVEDPKIFVDHKNGDTLDNRKENLRIASHLENARNLTRTTKRNTSGYRGVFLKKDKARPNPWCTKIRVNGKLVSLGHFKTPEEAAKAFDEGAKQYFGEFCGKLNFD